MKNSLKTLATVFVLTTKLLAVTPVSYTYQSSPDFYSDETGSQLTDGNIGTTPFNTNLGNGIAYEWVGWNSGNPTIIFDFGSTWLFSDVTVGTYKSSSEGIVIADTLNIQFSSDGTNFTLSELIGINGTYSDESRNTLNLPLSNNLFARYLKVTLEKDTAPSGKILVDELSFTGIPYVPPTAIFTVNPYSASCGETVTLDGSVSTAGSIGSITAYEWDFNNDFIVDNVGAVVSYPISALTSVINLRITTSLGIYAYASQNFSWNYGATAPAANAGGPYSAVENSSLNLNATATTDPNIACGDALSFDWDLDNDGFYDDATGVNPTISASLLASLPHFLNVPFTIKVRATDNEGLTGTANSTITILPDDPVADLNVSPNPASCGETLTFNSSASFHPNAAKTIISYDYDFDGNGSYDLTGAGSSVTYAYSSFGNYNATVRTTDNFGSTDTDNFTVYVSVGNNSPVSNAGGPYTVNALNDFTLDGSASSDYDASCGDAIASYSWDLNNDGIFGDVTGATPTVYWSTVSSLSYPATHTISLRVTDTLGANSTASTTLEISSSGGKMACFNGSSKIEVPNLLNNSSAFTIEAWFNYTNTNTWRWIYGSGSGFVDFGMAVAAGGNYIRYHGKTNSGTFTSGNGSISLTPNTWYHIAYVFDGTTWKGYINGVQDFQTNLSGTALTSQTQAFGAGFWGNSEYFSGSLDELRIWNFAKTQTEIQTEMSSVLNGNETGLLACYNLNQTITNPVLDATINGNNGNFVGTPCFTTSTAPLNGNSSFSNNNPTLSFTNQTGFVNSIVEPDTGSALTTFQFAIDYTDADGDLPASGYPKVLLDFNGNGNFIDSQDLSYSMVEENLADTDPTNGKRYVLFTQLSESENWKSQIVVQDAAGGNTATSILGGPFVSNDLLDVSIFANDITFSNANPEMGEIITISATIHNNSDFNAQNFVVELYEENNLVASTNITSLSYQSQTTVSWFRSFDYENYIPMKVVIDANNDLVEDNELNNFAIRPVTVGDYVVPGAIVVTAALSPSNTYQGYSVRGYGNAQYDDVFGSDFDVSGATVSAQIAETGATFSAYTNANGDFDFYFYAPAPGTYTIVGSVTDFTLTGNFGPLTLTVIAPPSCGTDLTSGISLDCYKVIQGNPVNGTATVTNSGCVPSGAFYFRYYDENSALIGSQLISGLAAGASQSFNFSTTFNNIGTSYVYCYADETNIVTETTESNNNSSCAVRVLPNQPDLTPSGNNIYGRSIVNQNYSYNVRVDNLGGAASGSFTANVYVDSDPIPVAVLNYTNIGGCASTCSFYDPCNLATQSFNYIFTTVGTHTVTIKVDEPIGSGSVSEYDETNNVYTGLIDVYLPVSNLNIGYLDLDVSPATPINAGDPLSLLATIRNNGESAIPSGTPVDVRFQTSGASIPTTTILQTYTSGLAVGESVTLSQTTSTPVFGDNDYTVTLDPNDTINESSNSDNSATYPLCWEFSLGEFPYTPMFWELTHYTGDNVNLLVALFNHGLYTGTNVETRFYVNDGSGDVYVGSDTELSVTPTRGNIYSHATGQSVFYTFPAAGTYTVTMVTDFPNAFTECNETNNTLIVPVTVIDYAPDLRILSQHVSPTELNPDPNEPIGIYLSFENIGNANAGAFSVVCKVDDIQLGSTIPVSGLAAGEDTTVAVISTWNSALVGAHVIRGFVDFGGTVAESDELNNEASRAVIVGESANLLFTNLNFSNSVPNLNEEITITASILNEGDLDCNATLNFYYVTDVLDTVLIGTNLISVLNNNSITSSLNWVVPDTVTTIYCEIVNSNPTEFDNDDNSTEKELGPTPFAQISVLPTSFSKAFATCEATQTDTLFISNSGTGTMTYTISSASSLVSESKTSGTVAPSSQDTVLVTFGSVTADYGTYSATIVINSNSLTNPQTLVPVILNYNGSGISLSAPGVDFGTIFNGSNTTQTITVLNNGNDTLDVTDIDLPSADFLINPATFEILPNQNLVLEITWNPKSTQTLLELITIHSNDCNDAAKTFSVSGNSTTPAYYSTFDLQTNLVSGSWQANVPVSGNSWTLSDDGSGNKFAKISGLVTAPNSNKNNQTASLVEASLESVTYDFSTFTSVSLMFYHDYSAGSEIAPEGCYVEISTNGGTTYPNQVAYYNSSTSGNVSLDVSGIVAGEDSVKARFRYQVTSGDFWKVDNILLGSSTALISLPPIKVETVVVLSTTSSGFEIGWTPSYDVDFAFYEVYFATHSDFSNALVWDSSDDVLLSDYNTNNTTVTNVFPANYLVKIRGTDFAGNQSEFSDPISVSVGTTLVTNLKIKQSGTQIQLSWDEINNPSLTITGFNVYRSTTPDLNTETAVPVGSNVNDEDVLVAGIQWTDTNLVESTYFYVVTALGSSNVTSPAFQKNQNVLSNSSGMKNKLGKEVLAKRKQRAKEVKEILSKK
ncbi:PKD domain-containing protein [bacterium]|nr:PKD domain-containing protein [bacterium]